MKDTAKICVRILGNNSALVDQEMIKEISKDLPFCLSYDFNCDRAKEWATENLGEDGLQVACPGNNIQLSFYRDKDWCWLGNKYYFRREKDMIFFKMLCD